MYVSFVNAMNYMSDNGMRKRAIGLTLPHPF